MFSTGFGEEKTMVKLKEIAGVKDVNRIIYAQYNSLQNSWINRRQLKCKKLNTP